jgi:hypothetical protein
VPVWVSRGSRRRAADFPDLPTAIQKILIGDVIRCVVTGNRFQTIAQPCLNFGCSFSQSRCRNRVVGSISPSVRARAKARPRPRSLNAADTRSLAHYLGHICNAPDSAFIRFNAERLHSTTRRDVGSAIAAPFSRCVSMRDTVSIVSPK